MEVNEKIYQKVIDAINQMISEGKVERGGKLPPERQLALDLGVSRTSIREALKTLEVIGLLERKHGGGTFIKEDLSDALVRPVSLLLAFDRIEKREILELRMMIESEMTYYAAQRITDDEIETLSDILVKMCEIQDELIRISYDKEFHFAIAKASRNHIIQNFYQAIYNLLDEFIGEIRYYVSLESQDLVNDTHQDIFDAIKQRDPMKAKEAMNRHMKIVNDYFEKNMKE